MAAGLTDHVWSLEEIVMMATAICRNLLSAVPTSPSLKSSSTDQACGAHIFGRSILMVWSLKDCGTRDLRHKVILAALCFKVVAAGQVPGLSLALGWRQLPESTFCTIFLVVQNGVRQLF